MRNTPVLQNSITPLTRIRRQPARRSLPEFQTTGRSREDDDEDENEAPLSRSQGFDAERDGQVAEKLG
jgi:hypothetical protein